MGDSTARLQVTRPNGRHETYLFNASGEFSEDILAIRFPTARRGFVLTGHRLYRTDDAGRTWKRVSYGPAAPHR